jgi:hypothetical protein
MPAACHLQLVWTGSATTHVDEWAVWGLRQRLAREHGLLNRQIARLDQACIGRYEIAG